MRFSQNVESRSGQLMAIFSKRRISQPEARSFEEIPIHDCGDKGVSFPCIYILLCTKNMGKSGNQMKSGPNGIQMDMQEFRKLTGMNKYATMQYTFSWRGTL